MGQRKDVRFLEYLVAFNCLVIIEKQCGAFHLFFLCFLKFLVSLTIAWLDFIAEMVLSNPVFLNEIQLRKQMLKTYNHLSCAWCVLFATVLTLPSYVGITRRS